MKVASRTHIGLVCKTNQDSLLIQTGGHGLYGVADGMGGHKAGDVASRMAVLMLERVLEDAAPSETLLRAAIQEVNQLVYDEQVKDSLLSGMGTTLTVLWEDNNQLFIGHVGDSRAYLFRAGELKQISCDHSMVTELVRAGVITKKMAARHPYRNVITRAIGAEPDVEVDIYTDTKLHSDKWLICSDGLTEHVSDGEISHSIKTLPIEDAADKLLQKALDGGGRDNISFVLLEVGK